jgi:cellulose synthase/poly-beta-1,6-N-acetylglucosamine synthase-like glycosyltransferase
MPVAANASPRISVIIPAYKTAHLIAGCLDSVSSQTYQDFEAIVVNDGSPDTRELEKVLQPYMGRIVYIVQPNKRAAGAETPPSSGRGASSWHSWTVMTHGFQITWLHRCS